MNPLAVLNASFDYLVTLDFETYYGDDYTLSKMTTESYVRDPRFETIGCGVKVDDGPTVWTDDAGLRRWAAQLDWSRTALLGHHAHFDGLILSHHYGIRPAFWFDTLSMGRALHGIEVGGSLEKLALAYGVGAKGHEVLNARGKRRGDFTPEEYERYGAYCRNDVELTRAIFDRMLASGFPEIELWNVDTTVRMFTEPTFLVNETLLGEFLVYEQKRKAELLARVAKDRSDLLSNEKFAAILRNMGVEPPRKISPRTKLETYAFAKSDPGMQALLEHPDDEIRWLVEARVGVKSTINETRTERFIRAGKNGRPVPVYLKYGAAHTFRWGGGDRMNFQNLERVPPELDPAKPYAGTLRKSLEAPAGRKLVVADSNAIEARTTGWLAGHEELVAGFRENRDVYSAFASSVYGRKIDRKKNPEDKVPGFVGKVAILGLGYQMGWLKFAMTLAAGPMGAKPIIFTPADAEKMFVDVEDFAAPPESIEGMEKPPFFLAEKVRRWRKVEGMPSRLPFEQRLAHCAVAHYLVKKYRAENKPIVDLWDEMEGVLASMVEGTPRVFGPGGCMCIIRHGIVLPSGLVMRYPGLRADRDEKSNRVSYSYLQGHGKERVHIYGGMLTENVVQALARIVVAEQLLYVRGAYGYHIVTMTHDEGVLCVPDPEAELACKRLVDAMKTPPEWAPGLPLNAEGDFAQVYGDAK